MICTRLPFRLDRLCLLGGLALLGGVVAAQPAPPADEIAEVRADPFGDHLIEISGRSTRQMADSISALARTDRWQKLDQLLRQLGKQKPQPEQAATMQRQIEPAVFVKMKLSSELSAEAKSALDQLAGSAREFVQSADRIRLAIEGLSRDSTDDRLAAARVLVGGGKVAIVELVSAAVADNPPADRDAILRALLRFGAEGPAALRQVALYGIPSARANAVQSLAQIDPGRYTVDLLTALHAIDSTNSERQFAAAALSRVAGASAARAVAIDQLESDLERRQGLAYRIDNDDQLVTQWSPAPTRDGVVFTRTRAIYAAYSDAVDAAARLRRIGALTSEQRLVKALVADLGYRLMIDPDWGGQDQIQELTGLYSNELTPASIQVALQHALASNDQPATIGLLRLVEAVATETDGLIYLGQNGAGLAPLVAAASHSDPRTRYEAAQIAAKLMAGRSIAGGSDIKQTLSEMARLGDLPLAVVVETRPEVVAPLLQIIADLGFQGVTVRNVAQLRRCVDRQGDIGLVLAKQQLADLTPIEAVDLLRRTSRGRNLPIVFYGPQQRDPNRIDIDAARWDQPTYWIDRPTTAAALYGVLDDVAAGRRLPPLSTLDRRRFRQSAVELLDPGSKIAG